MFNVNTTFYAACPASVTITPSTGPFSAGDILTCSSDGFPEPSYIIISSHVNFLSHTSQCQQIMTL